MGSMNGALAHEHRLQKEAEERYLDKLLQHAEEEVHKETARLMLGYRIVCTHTVFVEHQSQRAIC